MTSVVLPVIVFFFAIWMPGPEQIVPSTVTLHENNGKFSLEFDRIDFVNAKAGNDWFFVGPEVTPVDNYLREHYGVTVDLSQPQLTQDVNFTTTAGVKLAGSIGGVHHQSWYNAKVMSTWLPLHYELIDGMDAVTVELDVVPVDSLAGMNSRSAKSPSEFMRNYVEDGIRSEYLKEYGSASCAC